MIFQYIRQYTPPWRIHLSQREDCDRIVNDASIYGLYYSEEMSFSFTLASLNPSQSCLFPRPSHFLMFQTVHPQMEWIPHTKNSRF